MNFKLRGFLKRFPHSILAKIMLTYLIIFTVPLSIIYASMYKASREMALEDAGRQMFSALHSISDSADEALRSVSFVQVQMQTDPAFSEVGFLLQPLSQKSGYENFLIKEQLSRTLYERYLSNPYIYSLQLYNPYGDVIFESGIGQTRIMKNAPSLEEISEVSGENASPRSWYLQQYDGHWFFSGYSTPYSANNPSRKMFSRALVRLEPLLLQSDNDYPSADIGLFIENPGGGRLPINQSALGYADIVPDGLNADGWKSFSYSGNVYIACGYRSEYTGFNYLTIAPLTAFTSSVLVINEYMYYFLFTLGIIFVFCLFFLMWLIVKPMSQVSQKMQQAERGDLSVRINFDRRDELGYIGRCFNALLDSLDTLIYENYESKLRKQEFELKFIQTQLKEHFIYNTLDSIHWIATKHRVPQISEIIFNLSKFFRLTLNQGNDSISIEKMAEILRSYISLLNVRMDNMINCDISVDPALNDKQVIKYLFQPVLENAVVHGIQPAGGGNISVCFSSGANGMLRYSVSDYGVGIPPAELADIRDGIREDRSDGKYFALININRQLKLYFGSNYTFDIQSVPGHGTRVCIEFPGKESQTDVPCNYN